MRFNPGDRIRWKKRSPSKRGLFTLYEGEVLYMTTTGVRAKFIIDGKETFKNVTFDSIEKVRPCPIAK